MGSMSVNVFQLPEGGGGALCADAVCAGVLHSVPLVRWFVGSWAFGWDWGCAGFIIPALLLMIVDQRIHACPLNVSVQRLRALWLFVHEVQRLSLVLSSRFS